LVGGIVREVRATVGDTVAAGDVLAVLDSAELGEAKLDYLMHVNEIRSNDRLVPRAQAVHDNTLRLLAFLDCQPSLGDLQTFNGAETGDNLNMLIRAYADATSARQKYEREKRLYEREIASEEEFLAAKTDVEKAAAEYMASRDVVAFAVKQELFEVEAKRRAAKFAAKTAEQRLRLMGVAAKDIHVLDGLAGAAADCGDLGCHGCRAGELAEPWKGYFGNDFARCEIVAPVAGTVVERHIVRGENIGGDADIFTIADTATVWVNLNVHLNQLDSLSPGSTVTVRAEPSGRESHGRIAMLSPIVDRATRTAIARVVLDNDGGYWRPGLFVVGDISVPVPGSSVVVPKNAVQILDGEPVVFVPHGDAFDPVPVRVGRSDRDRVEIVAGLGPGAAYVAAGAFELKAKIVTSGLDPHAGHGH
jgi:multidrug efflux pump subunit AcrA (membrane-fusion protein)